MKGVKCPDIAAQFSAETDPTDVVTIKVSHANVVIEHDRPLRRVWRHQLEHRAGGVEICDRLFDHSRNIHDDLTLQPLSSGLCTRVALVIFLIGNFSFEDLQPVQKINCGRRRIFPPFICEL